MEKARRWVSWMGVGRSGGGSAGGSCSPRRSFLGRGSRRLLSTASEDSGESPCSPDCLLGWRREGQTVYRPGGDNAKEKRQAKRSGKNIPGRGSSKCHRRSRMAEASGAGAERVGEKRQEREVGRQ